MSLVGADRQAIEGHRKKIHDQVREFVAQLAEAGQYDCCIKVPCSHCALMTGGCACGEGLRRGEPVCDECAYLWTKGQGDEPVDPRTVRSFLEGIRAMKGEAPCVCGHDKVPAGP